MSRTSVVVGANRGLGLELTRQLIAQGDRVIATARDVAGATELAALGPANVLAVDIAHEHSVEAFGQALAAETDSVDLLINNAGINASAVGYDGPAGILDIPSAALLEVTQVNAVGPLLILRAALPLLEAAPDAWVVNISSQLGSMEVGLRMGRDVAYNVSKAALNMLVVCAARELEGRGIRSVAFHPGWVRTDMGGVAADIGADESAEGILAKVNGLTAADNGGFFRWDGTIHPW